MDAATQILVEPGNPFGFDPQEFAELVDGVREDLGAEYDVRVAYREQVNDLGSLLEVVSSAHQITTRLAYARTLTS